MKKKKQILLILILALLLLILVLLAIFMERSQQPGPDVTIPPATTTTSPGTTAPPTTQPTTAPTQAPTTLPATVPTTQPVTTQPPTTAPAQPPAPPQTQPPATAPTQAPTQAPKAQPEEVLAQTLSELKALAGTSREAEAAADGKKLTLTVSAQLTAEEAAKELLEKITAELNYDPAKADPNVAVGNPNPFSYVYRLTHIQTEDGTYTFQLEYRYDSPVYTVAGQNYDTQKLTADICAYLNSIGKTKFDSQTDAAVKAAQPVIVLLDRDYETVLSTVKAQVQSVCAQYESYDFYYKCQTLSVKGGQQNEAMLFYIYCK